MQTEHGSFSFCDGFTLFAVEKRLNCFSSLCANEALCRHKDFLPPCMSWFHKDHSHVDERMGFSSVCVRLCVWVQGRHALLNVVSWRHSLVCGVTADRNRLARLTNLNWILFPGSFFI